MASSAKSETLGLSLWEATDRPERSDFVNDNEQIERLLGGHINNAALHITESEKNYLKLPYTVAVYRGTGSTPFKINAPFKPVLILVMCTDMPPAVQREDGKLEVYWDLWTEQNLTTGKEFWGMGGIVYNPETKRMEKYSKQSDDNENIIRCLNDADKHYAVIYFPELG